MVTLGAKAPAFSLPDQAGKQVALQDLRGRWVVLYFYPKDDTPGCTVEACEFTAALPAFHGLDAVVYGCSADGAAAHTKFIAKHKLGIGLLTDADKKVMKAYGAYGKKLMYGKEVEGVIRSTVLIAPDGVVAQHWPKVKAEGHAEAVRAALAALQGGAVAPAAAAKKPAKAPAPATKVAAKPAAAKKPVTKAAAKPAAKAAAKRAK
ncbi:MAG: peroxiredoxin [Planctomycetes bacterium]|nr:peroxiredoxin [Planctomycetota bacterium]